MVEVQGPVEIVIMTGIPGAGWYTAARTTEGLSRYVVDNLPPAALPVLVDRVGTAERLTVVVGVRFREESEQLPAVFAEVKTQDYHVVVLFLEASDDVIVQCQEPSHRPLPLQYGGRLLDGIMREWRLLTGLRASAGIVVNISRLSIRQFVRRVFNHFGTDTTDNLSVTLMSFGFKSGLPVDADIALDVRFLPNPYWIPELRPKTGLSPDVVFYVLFQDAAQKFQECVLGVIEVAIPGYFTEGKRQVTVAIGCMDGKYRPTSMTEKLAIRLRGWGYGVSVLHRDLEKE